MPGLYQRLYKVQVPWHQTRCCGNSRKHGGSWTGRTGVARCSKPADALVISFPGRQVMTAKIPEPSRTFEVRARQPRLMNRTVATASFGRYGRAGTEQRDPALSPGRAGPIVQLGHLEYASGENTQGSMKHAVRAWDNVLHELCNSSGGLRSLPKSRDNR